MRDHRVHGSIEYKNGFTLIELMIVVVIIAILSAIAYPNYRQYVMRADRAEGAGTLLQLSQYLERYFTEVGSYTGATVPSNFSTSPADGSTKYNLAFATGSPTATAYTIVATPAGGQTSDTECGALTLSSVGVKCITNGSKCSNSTTAADRDAVAECW